MRRLTRRALPLLGLLLALAVPASARELDLVGSWYVLVHYKDQNAGNPDEERWDDRVWVFERKGRRLHWVEYPIVVFEDETGRFERRHTGQYARILHFWEPNAAQRANIAQGLRVNTRGSKNKSLRGSDAKGWSSGRRGSAASASVVTYQEVWSIDGLPDQPVFRRADFMGGGRTDTMEGLTEYATTERVGDDLLKGTFVRDGTRRGTFRMMRAGSVGALDTDKSQQEMQREAFRRSIETSSQIREQAAADLKASLDEIGIFPGADELDRLAGDSVQWTLDGVPPAEIRQRIGARAIADYWSFLPRGAEPDAAARYRLPFEPTTPRPLLRGVGGEGEPLAGAASLGDFEPLARHRDWARHSFKFGLPPGSDVLAARDGEVVRVVDGFQPEAGLAANPNAVWVLHADGTAGLYLHLAGGIPVRPGQRVVAGDRLGASGRSGYAQAPPLLHFSVVRVDGSGAPHSVDIRFDDGSEAGLVPAAGRRYPGGEAGS